MTELEKQYQQKTLYRRKIQEARESLQDYEATLKSINVTIYLLEEEKQPDLILDQGGYSM